jgi:hypothetical protein
MCLKIVKLYAGRIKSDGGSTATHSGSKRTDVYVCIYIYIYIYVYVFVRGDRVICLARSLGFSNGATCVQIALGACIFTNVLCFLRSFIQGVLQFV